MFFYPFMLYIGTSYLISSNYLLVVGLTIFSHWKKMNKERKTNSEIILFLINIFNTLNCVRVMQGISENGTNDELHCHELSKNNLFFQQQVFL